MGSENKDADQLCSYCTADVHLCFRIMKNVGFLMRRSISFDDTLNKKYN